MLQRKHEMKKVTGEVPKLQNLTKHEIGKNIRLYTVWCSCLWVAVQKHYTRWHCYPMQRHMHTDCSKPWGGSFLIVTLRSLSFLSCYLHHAKQCSTCQREAALSHTQHLAVAQQGSGHTEQLPFSHWEVLAVLRYLWVEWMRQLADLRKVTQRRDDKD